MRRQLVLWTVSAIVLATWLGSAAAQVIPDDNVVILDETTHSVSQCGAGFLQTTCVAVELLLQSFCPGQEVCEANVIGVRMDARLIAAVDTPLGGTADFKIEYCGSFGCLPLSPPVNASCNWPALFLPQSCEVIGADNVFLSISGIGSRPRVTANASSLLSGVSVEEDLEIGVDAQGQFLFP